MRALIFGGGKIARGFIAQLLQRSGYDIVFADMNRRLIDALNEAGRYYINVMGNEKESEWITGIRCIDIENTGEVASELMKADVAFCSVGGKNLGSLAKTIARAFSQIANDFGGRKLTLIACENWKNPASVLEEFILQELEGSELKAQFKEHIKISEAAVLRSGVEPAQEVQKIDPNAVSVTDYWELPVDADRMNGNEITLKGIKYTHNFADFLQRKIYTFNTTNAAISYIGMLKGYRYLMDAANDPEICEIVESVHNEMNGSIASALGVTLKEQQEFALKAVKKYQDRSVVDFLERHCRDPLRKLGPEDRIVGTARLVEAQGGQADYLAMVLAAAIYYESPNPEDESAVRLLSMRKEEGVPGVLEKVCEIKTGEPLAEAVNKWAADLKRKGWIHE